MNALLRIAVQIDPIERMLVERDTSLALMLEAQARGYEVSWFHPDDLFFDRGRIMARAKRVEVSLKEGDHYRQLGDSVVEAASFDVILIRQDPPFDMAYVSNTYLLERVETLVLNRPRGVRNIPEKLSILAFPDLIAPTFVGRDGAALKAFASAFEEIVLKPSFLAGGEGVVRLKSNAPDFMGRVMQFLEGIGKEPLVAQQFLPRVMEGDKRVFVLGGEPIGAVRRVPQGGDFRANLHVGGQPEASEIDARDREIVARVAPLLEQEGVLFAGLDVIDGMLTEINVTSPTLVRELKRLGGADIPALFWDRVSAMKR
ncbi:MAG: glutathione synthase [Hyphomonadaceae bacterium]